MQVCNKQKLKNPFWVWFQKITINMLANKLGLYGSRVVYWASEVQTSEIMIPRPRADDCREKTTQTNSSRRQFTFCQHPGNCKRIPSLLFHKIAIAILLCQIYKGWHHGNTRLCAWKLRRGRENWSNHSLGNIYQSIIVVVVTLEQKKSDFCFEKTGSATFEVPRKAEFARSRSFCALLSDPLDLTPEKAA